MTPDFNELIYALMDNAYSDGANNDDVPWPSAATIAARDALLAAIGTQEQGRTMLATLLDQLEPGRYHLSATLIVQEDKTLNADGVLIEGLP